MIPILKGYLHSVVELIGHVGCYVISGTYIFVKVLVPSITSNIQ